MIESPDKQLRLENHVSIVNWLSEKIGAEKLRAISDASAEKISVAVLDTGVKLEHEALKIWQTDKNYKIKIRGRERICRGGRGFNHRTDGDDFNSPDDRNGHGTRVAGIIAANGEKIKGVCPNATILPIKILDDGNRLGCVSFITSGIKSAVYARNELGVNLRVINISCGMSDTMATEKLNELKTAIRQAEKANILIVASAGNAGLNIGERKNCHYPASVEADNLIAVAATDAADRKLSHSNYLDSAIGALGDKISTIGLSGENSVLSDTSAAAAFVAGGAALLFAEFPALTCAEIKTALLKTGEDASGYLQKYLPNGRINVFAAYQKITREQKHGSS
jgi:subtilisin family serine protease